MAKHRQEKEGHHRRGRGSDQERAMRDASPGAGRQQGDGYKETDRAGGGRTAAHDSDPSRERKGSRNRRGGSDDDLQDRLADEPERREGMRSRGRGDGDNPHLGRERTTRQPDSPTESEERDHDLH